MKDSRAGRAGARAGRGPRTWRAVVVAMLLLGAAAGWLAARRHAPPPALAHAGTPRNPAHHVTPAKAPTLAGRAGTAEAAARDGLSSDGARIAAGTRALEGGAVDLSAVMRQVHFAFRPRGAGYGGGHTTYDVSLEGGHMAVTPSQGDAVRFSPPVIVRGDALVAAGAGVVTVGAEGQLQLAKDPVVEELQNGPDGVEQRWRFAERLPGSGDLEVRIPLATGELVGETEGGLHFTAGEGGVRYGHGTWIDGLGAATRVPARWDAGAVVLSVPAAVLDGSVYPAVLDPVIGPERAMDEPLLATAPGDQKTPAAAWNGECHLVVWEDRQGSTATVRGARVTSTGAVLDPAGLVIASASGPVAPAVASDGRDFLVIWRSGWSAYNITGARVRADGAVLDASGFTLSAAPNIQDVPAVAWAGTSYLAVWRDGRNGNDDVYGARVTPDGAVLDGAGIAIAAGTTTERHPAVACDGSTCLVVWAAFGVGGDDIYAVRVSDAGVLLDPDRLAVSTAAGTQYYPAVAAGGGSFLVTWEDASAASAIFGARVDGAGIVLDPAGIRITSGTDAMRLPAVAWNGTDFVALWQRTVFTTSQIWGARVGADGIVKDAAGFAVAGAGAGSSRLTPSAACDGASCLAVWSDDRYGQFDVVGARVSSAGQVLDTSGVLLSNAAAEQLSPAVAWNGDPSAGAYLVVWQDLRASQSYDIYGVRLSRDGLPLDAGGIAVSTAQGQQTAPAVASGGAAGWLVVWDDRRSLTYADVYGARVSVAGAVQEPNGVRVSTRAQHELSPAVAFDGVRWLVAWYDGNGSAYDIYAARVSSAGAVLDAAGFVISNASNIQAFPSVACSDAECLVAWEDLRSGSYMDLYGARVSQAGSVLGTLPISTAAGNQFSAAVARGSSCYLVTWAGENGAAGRDVFAARVGGDGALLDAAGFAVVSAPSDQMSPALAWDGATFLVAWRDFRTGYVDVNGARVTDAGAVLDAGGFPIAAGADAEQNPALASSAARRFLVAYERNAPMPPLSSTRVFARTVYLDAAPAAIDQSLTVVEDGALAVTLAATDPDGDPVTLAVATGPEHGALGGTPPDLTYTPDPDYTGSDAFSFVGSDGALDSAPATVSITVTPVNDPPLAEGLTVATDEDTEVAIRLPGTDVDGDALDYTVVAQPAHGTLRGSGASLTYAPAADYAGPDELAFRVSDGTVEAGPATVSLSVAPVNDAPVAAAQSQTVPEDGSAAITLAAGDVEGDALVFTIVTPPSHGALTGVPPDVTYTPAADHAGPDAFSFAASDGALESAPATVSITVTPVNDAPLAAGQTVTTDEDTDVVIALAGSDRDGDPLMYVVVTPPAHGTLRGSGASVTYSPARDYHGPDTFAFQVADGTVASTEATVNVTVAPVNDAPVAAGRSVEVAEDGTVEIDLLASDADGDPLTFTTVTPPAHGTLSGSGAHLTYNPAPDYAGPDAFSFRASDGSLESGAETVLVDVGAVNDAPSADDQTIATDEDTAVQVTLTGSDRDGDLLVSFVVVTPPGHGSLTGSGASLTYEPDPDFHGDDAFAFLASDGVAESVAAAVTLAVSPVNDAPVAAGQAVEVAEGQSVAVTLAAADVDGDSLTFSVSTPPAHGSLSGAGATLTYTPGPGYHGADAFAFEASDGGATSAPATVTIEVAAAPDEPKGGCGCTTAGDAAPLGTLLFALLAPRRPPSARARRRP